MHAAVYHKYGPAHDVISVVDDYPVPEPKDTQVLVRVHATSVRLHRDVFSASPSLSDTAPAQVNPGDCSFLTATPWPIRFMQGLFRPKKYPVLGMDVSGVVARVGAKVTRLAVGDVVYGDTEDPNCFADFAVLDESVVALKPSSLSHAQAAAVPDAAMVALQGLRDHGKLEAGGRVLIVGACTSCRLPPEACRHRGVGGPDRNIRDDGAGAP